MYQCQWQRYIFSYQLDAILYDFIKAIYNTLLTTAGLGGPLAP